MGASPSALVCSPEVHSISTNLTCSVLGGYDTYPFNLTITTPLISGSGKDIYYTDIVASVDLPGEFQSSFPNDSDGFTTRFNIPLDLTNSSPLQINITGTADSPVQDPRVRLPDSGSLPALGPVSLNGPGKIHQISLGKVNFTVNLGTIPLPVYCIQQNPPIVIGAVYIA